ncbi:hypothetical protein DNTS_013765 [Danionella cerebrum]|uniref:Coiled-coil domain-containing protein 103 n=1 Tax=Danionella cerebrum TaxID=2873325 RepID=A0A553NIW9_9TELE|nr:hypothetical protein DNTS_013765 [Danionella translucida]
MYTLSKVMENSEVINFSSLEKEVQATLEADRKYRRENDAKFRALNQNVASYEEFRDIVLASHLKPLDRKDISEAPRKQPWNPVAYRTKQESNSDEQDQLHLSEIEPRSASEFIRDWRRLTGGPFEKYDLLVRLGGETLEKIFKTEIGLGLLGEFLLVLSRGLKPRDVYRVIGVLDGLTRTGRFSLGLSLLSQAEKKASVELFQKLQGSIDKHHSAKDYSCDGLELHEPSLQDNMNDISAKLKEVTEKYNIEK